MDDKSRIEPRATELHTGLVAWAHAREWKGLNRTKVPIDEVQKIFGLQSRRGHEHATQRTELIDVLAALTQAGMLTPLRETDREKVALPLKVWLEPIKEKDIPTQAVMPRWHPSLSALAKQWPTARADIQECYAVLNNWAWSSPDLTPLHQRERALDIFGRFGDEEVFAVPEKTFDTMRARPFFNDRERLWKIIHV